MTATYFIAEHCFSLNSLFNHVHEYLKEYRSDKTPSFEIVITKEDIIEETKYDEDGVKFSKEQYEVTAVLRKLMNIITKDNYILYHGSCISIDNEGVLFSGRSGAGKSTHARLYKEYFKDRMIYINDDKPILKVEDDKITAFGTPWNGKERLSNNTSIKLKAICFINQAKENRIEELDSSSAFSLVYKQSYLPPKLIPLCMNMLSKILKNVKVYNLYCDISKEAVMTSYNGMK